MSRRFEFTDATSNKFWEITVTGKTVFVQYGRIGTDGQTQVKAHSTPAEAKAAAEKQVAEKVKKGYREVGAKKAPARKTPAKKVVAKKVVAKQAVAPKRSTSRTSATEPKVRATTRRFEFTDATSNKFWEVTVTGKQVTVRYGRIGTEGQTQVKNHASPAAAKAAADKQIAEKAGKGYTEVGSQKGGRAAAPRTVAKKSGRTTLRASRTAAPRNADSLNNPNTKVDCDAILASLGPVHEDEDDDDGYDDRQYRVEPGGFGRIVDVEFFDKKVGNQLVTIEVHTAYRKGFAIVETDPSADLSPNEPLRLEFVEHQQLDRVGTVTIVNLEELPKREQQLLKDSIVPEDAGWELNQASGHLRPSSRRYGSSPQVHAWQSDLAGACTEGRRPPGPCGS